MAITDLSQLRALYGEPIKRARDKVLSRLDRHCRDFIAISPFCVLSTAGADGRADASPRGDGPGFVAVLDDSTLLLPDRPGNKRVDSMQNILENPHVGLLFFVPGMNETLRVNGRARIVTDDDLLKTSAVNDKIPRSGLLVEVEEAFLHCAKALIRSKLWDPAIQIDRSTFPTYGRMLADQMEGLDGEETERSVQEGYRNRLY